MYYGAFKLNETNVDDRSNTIIRARSTSPDHHDFFSPFLLLPLTRRASSLHQPPFHIDIHIHPPLSSTGVEGGSTVVTL